MVFTKNTIRIAKETMVEDIAESRIADLLRA